MSWFSIVAIFAIIFCLSVCLFQLIRLIQLGKPKDFSKPAGDLSKAIPYSFTVAMLPSHKESAYLHLPEYTAGILFHIGTFVSLVTLISRSLITQNLDEAFKRTTNVNFL